MRKIVLITGATSGIGAACAHQFGKGGFDVIVTGRRGERLDTLRASLVSTYGIDVLPLECDVQDREKVFEQMENLPVPWRDIDVLINNAGLALGRDYFEEASLQDWETMIDTNLKGLIYMSRAVLPYMTGRGRGHIINLGSVAGKEVYEKGNVYCATKSAVSTLSEAMRIDLLRHGIKVTCVHPGAVDTEFSLVRFKGDTETAQQVYKGFQPLTADDVASVIYYSATLPAHVCINDLVMTCTQQANAIFFNKK
jgi:3-hydroxy acid dehydrogenase / malonic semialdehyde reductase